MAQASDPDQNWWIYRGTGNPHDGISRLPAPPPWRSFDGVPYPEAPITTTERAGFGRGRQDRARNYMPTEDVIGAVNTALLLRRPLLVTGRPGTGKSTLAYAVAYELGLGPVLYWPITTRSTLGDALYRYDAIGRLHDVNLRGLSSGRNGGQPPSIGDYIQLGPLGTAILPRHLPRVLLIDELDKSDVDLPNDLLNIFEEGQFEIPELARHGGEPVVRVRTADGTAEVEHGLVRCHAFPFVVITSNGDREFPAPFLRRCIRLEIAPPDGELLAQIVAAQLGPDVLREAAPVLEQFLDLRNRGELATDQLLNAVYLASFRRWSDPDRRELDRVLRHLGDQW